MRELLREIGYSQAELIYQGTNTIYRSNEVCIRVMSRLDEQAIKQANDGAEIANQVYSLNPLLTTECLEMLDSSIPVQLWRWREASPAQCTQAVQGVGRWREIAETVNIEEQLINWTGPMRSIPQYMETMAVKVRKYVQQEYQQMLEWNDDLLANKNQHLMHGDLNPGNILKDDKSVFLIGYIR